MTAYATAAEAGLSEERVARVYAFLEQATADISAHGSTSAAGGTPAAGSTPGAAIQIARGNKVLAPKAFGRQRLESPQPSIRSDTIFLIASLTKPMVATAMMMLVERGLVALDDPIRHYVPEFGENGKGRVRVRHLLTHTSGLPDMLDDNRALRESLAPLERFVERICEIELDFRPGTSVRYQSMGFAMMGEIVRRVTGTPLPEFMRRELFEPLGMVDTSLGADDAKIDRIAGVNIRESDQDDDWGWNSSYWRHFGAPWGGMLSTAEDVMRFCRMFANGGALDGHRVISRATAASMTRDHTSFMPSLPRKEKLAQAWGLGWRIYTTHGWSYCGDILTPGAYGHGGATGTVMWVDPALDLSCVVLTTQPSNGSNSVLNRCSNIVASCVE